MNALEIIDEGLDYLEENFYNANISSVDVTADLFSMDMQYYRGYEIKLYISHLPLKSSQVLIRAKDQSCLWWWDGTKGQEWCCQSLKRKDQILNVENCFESLFLKVLKETRD